MSNVDIDQLKINIETKASSARSELDGLASDVRKLRSSVGGAGRELKGLSSALSGLNVPAGAVQGLRGVADAAKGLKGASLSKSFANNVGLLAESLQLMPSRNLSNFAAVADGLSKLNGVKLGKALAQNVGTLGDSLARIPEGAAEKGAAISQLAAGAAQLGEARIGKSFAQNLGTLADSLARVPADAAAKGAALSAVATGAARLQEVKVSKSLGTNISGLAESLSKLNETRVDSAKFSQLAAALSELAAIPKNSLTSTLNALRKLPEVMSMLNGVDMGQLATKCRELSDALGTLPAKMQAVNAGLRTTVRALGSMQAASAVAPSGISGLGAAVTGVLGRFGRLKAGLSAAGTALGYFVEKANSYVEDMNLFNVALGSYADQARSYAQQVSDTMGINIQDWLRNQGTFTTMAKGMGVAEDSAYTMGQQLTQLSYDLASLYNMSDSEAFEKVRAGLAGELEPLRALGYDLSVARLQQEAYNLGLTKSVSEMTQAEKAQLRYYAIMNQVTWAQGDMARSLDSPANAMRVFAGACNTAATNIGKIFLPMIQAIMPVCIQAAKVVATLANMLADLTGGNQIASVDYSGGGTLSSLADDAGAASDALGKTGDSAGKAADKVKELKRQVLGFDEINMFSGQSDGSGGSGGSGGGGGGNGGGAGGSIPIQGYDFLGDGNELSDRMKDLVDRLCKAWAPLLESVKAVVAAIRHQFDGLDIAGAAENAFVGFNNLLSNFVRQAVEIVGPLAVALNVPETFALSLDLFAQACLTLSAVVNGAGTAVKNFSDTALIPLAAWVGQKLRDAIYLCISVMQDWQDWFQQNVSGLAQLGKAAGNGAALVLALARALADAAFSVAAVAVQGVSSALQALLGVLVNSAPARSAVALLSAGLTALAVGNGIARGLSAVGSAFTAMAAAVEARSASASAKAGLLSTSLGKNLAKGMGDAKAGAKLLADSLGLATPKMDALRSAQQRANSAAADAADRLVAERTALNNMRSAAASGTGEVSRLALKQQEANVRLAEADVRLQQNRVSLANAGAAYQSYASSAGRTVSGLLQHKAAEVAVAAQVGRSTVAKAAAAAQTTALTAATKLATVAEGAMATASGVLAAAINAIPGMVLVTALSLIVTNLDKVVAGLGEFYNWLSETVPPIKAVGDAIAGAVSWLDELSGGLLSTIGSAVGSFLGLSDATAQVTDATEEANQVLSEEQQRINDNLESMREYEKTHDGLSDALAVACMDEERFQQYLAETGQTFDDVRAAQEEFVTATVNGFERIDTSSQLSLESVNENLANNIAVQQQWSDDLVALMEQTGLDANSTLVQSLQSAGPGKMAEALHEVVTDPASENSQRFIELMAQTGQVSSAELAGALRGGTGDVSAAMSENMDAAQAAVTEGGEGVAQAASDVDLQTVERFGSHYGEAFDAGRNLAGGFGDGVRDASDDASRPAAELSQAVVDALNGGSGYSAAKSAGENLVGGYADGIKARAGLSKTQAQSALKAVVQALNGGSGTSSARTAGSQLMQGYSSGIQSVVSSVRTAAASARTGVVSALNGGSGTSAAASAGSQLMGGYRSGLQSQASSAVNVAKSASSQIASAMRSQVSAATSAGSSMMGGFSSGLRSQVSAATSAGSSGASGAASGLSSGYWSAYSSGQNLMQGYVNGINSKSSSVYWAAYNTASRAVDAVNRAQRSHSPSKLTEKSGIWFDQGYMKGIEGYAGKVEGSVRSMVSDALDATEAAARMGEAAGRAYSSALGGSVDAATLTDTLAAGEAAARRASVSYGSVRPTVPARHAQTAVEPDDAVMAQTIASAVARGVLSVQAAGAASRPAGDTTIVLRVGSEELARAVARGNDSLARRGVIEIV